MKKVMLNSFKSDFWLSEIFQSLDIKFSFVNKELQEITAPAKCRDFLADCIWSKNLEKPVYIYGFNYNYKETPYDDNRFSIKFPNEEAKNNFLANFPLLHEKEKIAKVALTKVYETQFKDILLVQGSNHWLSNYWKLSLYTFYIKLFSYKDITQLKKPENEYIKLLTKEKENVMLLKIRTKSKKESVFDEIHSQHNRTGFYSLLKNYNIELTKEIFGETV